MSITKQTSKKDMPYKRENALANSCYSIVKKKKEAKTALEKSNIGLAVKR